MIQLMPDAAAIELVQARQAQAQSPAQGIAAQWSAAQIGAPATGLATIAAANPMPGLAGGMGGMGGVDAPPMASGPLPMESEETADFAKNQGFDEFSWSGAGAGAAKWGTQGALLGAKVGGGYGALILGALGAIGGGIAGGVTEGKA